MPTLPRSIALTLCALLIAQPFPSLAGNSSAKAIALTADQRTLHLLNRFTFGPTSQDIAIVQTSGIDNWFEQQLHPDRLPLTPADQQLTTRLAEFPALNLPTDELLYRFPSGAEIRQAAKDRRPIPNDPTLSLIYRRHIAKYEEKQAQKAEAKPATMANNMATSSVTVTPQASEETQPTDNSLNQQQVQKTLALPPADRVNRILAMPPADYEQLRSSLKGPQKLQLTQDLTPAQRELLLDYDNPTRTVVEELQSQRLLRDIYSSHQLEEVMTTFWLNHFNIYLHKNEQTPYYLVSYERDAIRPRALGNFEDLLVATATSPAMLIYLDNATSTGPDSPAAEKQNQRAAQGKPKKPGKFNSAGLNENYARELMELHTLGVNGGYTQKDVTEVAKVLTGWTLENRAAKPGQGGGFFFDETRHQPGTKLVLGKKIKENGQKEGLQLLHMLATSPATAHFIAQELAVAFVSDTPPPALVNRMAATFQRTHGDIPSILRTLVHSPEFWSTDAYQAKVKTPLEYVISAARATGTEVTNTQPLINALNQMGMPLYACVPPTGYSDKAADWVSTGALVTRMNFSLSLATNHYPGITSAFTPSQLELTDPAQAELALEHQLIPSGISEKTRNAILNQLTPPPTNSLPVAAKPPNPVAEARQAQARQAQPKAQQQNAQLAGLLLGSPEFQRR